MKKHATLDEEIAARIRESELNGEIRSARSWGKPIDFGDGYDETPQELRMGFKMLKDSGFVPPEIQMLKELEQLRFQRSLLDPYSPESSRLRDEISELQLKVALQMERLRS
jgi:hypothetical protein